MTTVALGPSPGEPPILWRTEGEGHEQSSGQRGAPAVTTSLLLAVLGAILMGLAAVAQAAAARRVSGPGVLIHPLYLLGLGTDFVGWLLSLVAMRHESLMVVQTILAASLIVTVVVARLVLSIPLPPTAIAAVLALSGAVAVVSVAGLPGPPAPAPAGAVPVAVLALGVAGLLCVLLRRAGVAPQAILAGLGYAGTAICARAVEAGTPGQILASPLSWCGAAFGLLGTVMFARALQASPDAAAPATAWLWVIEVIVPTAVGLGLLGDRLRPGWAPAAGIALAVALASAVVLSRASVAIEVSAAGDARRGS